jgi:hypothetical protein
MRYAKGVSWIEDTRIPFVDDSDVKSQSRAFTEGSSSHKGQAWNNHLGWEGSKGSANPTKQQGRFTPNLLVCDDVLNDGRIGRSGFNPKAETKQYGGGNFGGGKTNDNGLDYGDKGTNSRYYDLDKWFDKMIDEL